MVQNFLTYFSIIRQHSINLKIPNGKLIAIVGSIGSGKSSLLSALLGNMLKLTENEVNVNGSIAYAPQQPWIQNATVRQNIMFNKPMDHVVYQRVLDACSLIPDLDLMPSGDMTEIGERGINLSGGQRQRISLARCIYADAKIHLFDDPLSAVDAHVGKHIFDHVIGPFGLLKDKTRLFVTNSLSYLAEVDEICMVKDGQIIEKGTFTELTNRHGIFSEFISKFHLRTHLLEEKTRIISNQSGSGKGVKETSGTEKIGARLVLEETSESTGIKVAVFREYLMAWGSRFLVAFILITIVCCGFELGAKFWLSDWTNGALIRPEKALESKFYQLGVYVLLSTVASKCG